MMSGRGASLIDVALAGVVAVVTAAVTVPVLHESRLRGADSGLIARLRVLRMAGAMFEQEHHGRRPTADRAAAALTSWTDELGDPSPVPTAAHRISPYLRLIPELPVGRRAGARGIAAPGAAGATGAAWLIIDGPRWVRANTDADETDARGRAYSAY